MSQPDDDRLLAAALAGELDLEDPALRDLAQRDPEAARRLDDLLTIQLALDVEAAQQAADDGDRELVARTLARIRSGGSAESGLPVVQAAPPAGLAPQAPAPEPQRAPPAVDGAPAARAWLRAAALLLAALTTVWLLDPFQATAPGDDPLLGPADQLTALAPLGAVDDFRLFAAEPPAGAHVGRAELTVRAADDPPDAPPRLRLSLPGPRWEPDAAAQASLPDDLHWELSLFDGQDAWLGAASARAWRRR